LLRPLDPNQPPSALRSTIREAVEGSRLSLRAIADIADMDASQLSRYLNGQSGLTDSTLDRLFDTLNLEVKPIDLGDLFG